MARVVTVSCALVGLLAFGVASVGRGQAPGSPPIGQSRRPAALLQERLVVLQEIVSLRRRAYELGEATPESFLSAEKDLLTAKLELTSQPAERLVILPDLFENARRLEDLVAAEAKTSQRPRVDLLVARAARLKAEADLAGAGEGLKPASK